MFCCAKRFLLPLLLAAVLPACATVTTGTTTNISVLTDPAGAACTLTRQGEVVGVVNPTPGTVRVSNSIHQIDVRCVLSGFEPGLGVIPADFQAMTLGNILLGGIVGVVVDAASGAVARYPGSITISMAREGSMPPAAPTTAPALAPVAAAAPASTAGASSTVPSR
jgi:hypothetical protein